MYYYYSKLVQPNQAYIRLQSNDNRYVFFCVVEERQKKLPEVKIMLKGDSFESVSAFTSF